MYNEEYEILKNMDSSLKWIARDRVGLLFAHMVKPRRYTNGCWVDGYVKTSVNKDLFQFINWEDKEPYNIPDLVRKYEFLDSKKKEVNMDEVEIPRIVADEIEKYRNRGENLWDLVYDYQKDEIYSLPLCDWIYGDDIDTQEMNNRQNTISKAFIHGYKVEEEQKYYVMNKDDKLMLFRFLDIGVKSSHGFTIGEILKQSKQSPETTIEDYQLTEDEIRDYDERYWSFRRPIEEVELNDFKENDFLF